MAAKITFEFKDSALFRVVHADGVFGGPTPSGDLYLNFYNEHAPMPIRVTHEVSETGIGREVMDDRVSEPCIARTNEVGVVMSFTSAVSFREWLTRRIDDMVKLNPGLADIESAAKKESESRMPVKA